ncbi:IS3 family transposase [Novosphingobium mangrovi (ex Hu et al. 2023)]|uniref:IS3 family transposase n=2 Tax=Novosphingobium TaxID=165696 RepID=A0ABT0AC27_9SPHN|nr:IS3 family transposase [Novosphingobium mangrovi (ex Hu et al. 2023)]MCJ1960738.1 IS3 family transposase [Novosphingobium mangrovi (ex Hu et al. 2023)]
MKAARKAARQEQRKSRRPRRNHSPAFKAKVPFAAIKGEKTLAELAHYYDLHPNQITTWRMQLLEGAAGVFGSEKVSDEPAVDVKTLHAKIGELTLANGFFGRRARQGRSVVERKAMIDRSHTLPVKRQAKELGISRGSVYYLPRPVSSEDLAIMCRIDALHLAIPFAGSRMMRDFLRQEDITIGRCHVASLIKKMAIEAVYRRPSTSKPAPGHKIYPYLLRKLPIVKPNQVSATDISYIPMVSGFVYLVAIVDWFSREVLSHRISIALEADFCVEALEEALARYGRPEIFNTDQGSQFTSQAFTGVLRREGIAISMDGRGAWRDNVVVERLWRSVKYEEVYLHAYACVSEARSSIGRYLGFYNARRPHSSLGGRTPDQTYFDNLPQAVAA